MIDFVTKDVELPVLPYEEVKDWIVSVARTMGRTVGPICYCFSTDEYILEVNREFLQHDYYTDIITFDNSVGSRIAGDILISLDTVASNAGGLNEDVRRELMRVIIHGVLHLCGVDDKAPGARAVMEKCENDALAILPFSIDDIDVNLK